MAKTGLLIPAVVATTLAGCGGGSDWGDAFKGMGSTGAALGLVGAAIMRRFIAVAFIDKLSEAPTSALADRHMTDEEICSRAIDRGDWNHSEQSQPNVREAQRRGHTPATCAQPGQSEARNFPL